MNTGDMLIKVLEWQRLSSKERIELSTSLIIDRIFLLLRYGWEISRYQNRNKKIIRI